MFKYIWVKGEKYYYNKTINGSFYDAVKIAKNECRRIKKCKYFVLENKNGMMDIWLNKKITLW